MNTKEIKQLKYITIFVLILGLGLIYLSLQVEDMLVKLICFSSSSCLTLTMVLKLAILLQAEEELNSKTIKTFKSVKELIKQAKKDGACEKGILWAKKYNDLGKLLEECPHSYRLWALMRGYIQFSYKFNFENLSTYGWIKLLTSFPQFADKCDFKQFNGSDLAYLLSVHPHLADKVNWKKLKEHDWGYLISRQPQFIDKYNKRRYK